MRRSLVCFNLLRLFQSTDVLASVKYPILYNNYVCKRQFTEPRTMAEGGQKNTFMVVGLGNLGSPGTRHSVGMQVTDKLSRQLGTAFVKKKECESMIAMLDLEAVTLILVKPRKPMNLNGRSVAKTVKQYNIMKENIILVHDNLDQKLGAVTLKEKGGSANGHNGVKSVAASIPSGLKLPRITIGIDRPTSQGDVIPYVLDNFPKQEQAVIDKVIDKAVIKISEFVMKRTQVDILAGLSRDINNNEVT